MRCLVSRLIPILTAIATTGCSSTENRDDFESKRIYSVLQSQELSLRNKAAASGYAYTHGALGTSYDTIAFPDRTRSGSYVVILANARKDSEILSVPEPPNGLVLSSKTLDEIARKGIISKPVEHYLRTRTKN
jgi:hypothetical protein